MPPSPAVLRRSTPAVLRRSTPAILRRFSTAAVSSSPSHHRQPPQNHQFLTPDPYVSSWMSPCTPEEAQAKLAMLRRDYAKKVREVRKGYIREMEVMRMEKARRDQAKKEEVRVKREERDRVKAQEREVKAQEREITDKEFRDLLLKERAEKLENWRMKMKAREAKKSEARELLRRKSSMWIDEADFEGKIMEASVDIVSFGK
ncbi:hypothetical protein MLD38_010890 [Melastoma candidum]|uniref:Uncharacterized protein n=1 Tax=Melastoma candidum TaxID=119954 RepID=A0ACB9R1B8_9MYRT|nr:hypothetical protein MLD38_010890 [Melastoma candidum]